MIVGFTDPRRAGWLTWAVGVARALVEAEDEQRLTTQPTPSARRAAVLHLSHPKRHLHPNPSRFGARIRSGGNRTVVQMNGELDLAAGAQVQAALDRAVGLGARNIVIDLSGVTFIDAHGIGLIVSAWRSAIERGVRFRVSGVEGQVAHMVALVGLEDLVVPAVDAGDPDGDVDGRR